ncbi:hypothetical protein HELRODRAFT_193682 [Helobdella robusta]|uniref:poly(ADP-ribose) glycohydrolase n=1 Tax=Helobdella robusta TaxID=6412 RepID=T1FV92_HELRO|nr:hypothetical protein HELRODRAFT_193682 [Helobdella robusta]ESN94977.1 hypothetical protein HELRODRAFT_193682 [Helobdella robusta]
MGDGNRRLPENFLENFFDFERENSEGKKSHSIPKKPNESRSTAEDGDDDDDGGDKLGKDKTFSTSLNVSSSSSPAMAKEFLNFDPHDDDDKKIGDDDDTKNSNNKNNNNNNNNVNNNKTSDDNDDKPIYNYYNYNGGDDYDLSDPYCYDKNGDNNDENDEEDGDDDGDGGGGGGDDDDDLLSAESCSKYPWKGSAMDYSVIMPNENSKYWSSVRRDLELFRSKIIDHHYLKDFILNHRGSDWSNFEMIPHFFKYKAYNDQLTFIAELALKLPELFQKPLPRLVKGQEMTLTLTQLQAACLLAHAFFCTLHYKKTKSDGPDYGRRNLGRSGSKSGGSTGGRDRGNYGGNSAWPMDPSQLIMPTINFCSLYNLDQRTDLEVSLQKFKCVMYYFKRISESNISDLNNRKISYQRKVLEKKVDWRRSTERLSKLRVKCKGAIENAKGHLQVDFANKLVGGGVLGRGCVQEEIRFLICPELIVARLFTEELDDNECLLVTGAERFSSYEGYSHTFKWSRPYHDAAPLLDDKHGRRLTQVVAMDALYFTDEGEQFTEEKTARELNKAIITS